MELLLPMLTAPKNKNKKKNNNKKNKMKKQEEKKPKKWSAEEVVVWLEGLGLNEYSDAFRDAKINGKKLLALDKPQLKDLGVNKLGHVKKLTINIDLLKKMKKENDGQHHLQQLPGPLRRQRSRSNTFCEMMSFYCQSLDGDHIGIKCFLDGDISVLRVRPERLSYSYLMKKLHLMYRRRSAPSSSSSSSSTTMKKQLEVRYEDLGGDVIKVCCDEDVQYALNDWQSTLGRSLRSLKLFLEWA